jgi:hypothetical protein
MSANLTTLAGLLKRIQSGEVVDQQNLEARAMDQIAKATKKYNAGGQGFFGAINDYGNESVGALNETEQFRTIDNEDYQQYKVVPKVLAGPVQITGLAAEAADSDEEAFAEAVLKEVEGAKKRLRKDMNRQFFGIGTGVLGFAAAAVASNVTSFTVASAQYFRKNMVIDAQSNGVELSVSHNRITNVDKVNNIIYLTNSLGVSLITTDIISKENVRSNMSSDGKEMMGLDGIVDDSTQLTTFQSLSAASLYEWRGVVIQASGANLTSDLMQRLLDDVGTLGGQDPDTLITHKLQRRKYLDLVVPEKRFQDLKLDAGFQKLSFNGIELWLDVDCQRDHVFAISKNRIYRFEVSPLAMGGLDGSDTWLRATNFDQFQAYWKYYGNFGTDKRNAHGKLTGLAVPTGGIA